MSVVGWPSIWEELGVNSGAKFRKFGGAACLQSRDEGLLHRRENSIHGVGGVRSMLSSKYFGLDHKKKSGLADSSALSESGANDIMQPL